MLPTAPVGSDEYYVKLIQMCRRGMQACRECPLVACHDNQHPDRLWALERTVLNFACEVDSLNRKLRRKDELLESSMLITKKHQQAREETRGRVLALQALIEQRRNEYEEGLAQDWDNQLDVNEREKVDALGDYLEGLEDAWGVLSEEKK